MAPPQRRRQQTTASVTITDDDTPPAGTGGNNTNAGDPIVFSVSGSDTVSEDPQDSDNNQVTYTVGYTGALNAGQTASVNIAHSLNQSVASDYTTNVLEAINASVATTPGVSFNGTTLTFGGTVPTSTSASRFAGTASTVSVTGDVAWGSISGAAGSSPSDYALAQIDNHDISDQLRLTNYGFSIPSNAVINTYTVELNNAAAARLAADTQSFNTFLDQLADADWTLFLDNLDSKSTYDDAIADADQALAASNLADWNQYEFLMSFLDEDWINSVFDARSNFNSAKGAALAARDAADLASFNTLSGVFNAANATLAGARGAAAAIRDAAISAANAQFDQAVAAAMAVFDAAHNAYLAAHGYGELGDDGSPSLYATLQTDSQYQSDMAAVNAAYESAIGAANAAYESAWDDAKQTYDEDTAAAAISHYAVVATNGLNFFGAVAGIVAEYLTDAADHAATANSAITTATTTRDAAFAAADGVYDGAVATAAAARATAKADHDAAYAAGEEPEWQQLQWALTAHEATHTGAVTAATLIANAAWDNAWNDYDAVANNDSSTPAQVNAALAARIVAMAATVANYNNAIAAADAAKTNADADSWAAYDTAVNGLITVYWNAEAASDAEETHAVNAAYVVWANTMEAARAQYSTAVSDAEAQRTLADAQSENEAWHDINAEVKAWDIADANEDNSYAGVLTGLEAAFITTVDPHWVTLANAVADADAAKAVAAANAHAAAVGRWASSITNDSPLAAYNLAYEAAIVARTEVIAAANAAYAHTANAAEGVWTTIVTPAWVTYEDEVTDHTAAAETSIAGYWETFQNAIDDADLAYTTAAIPLWQGFISDLNADYTTWVSDTADAERAYGDELANNAMNWVQDVNASEETWANQIFTHWVGFCHLATGLYVTQVATISAAINNWAATVAAQINGTSNYQPTSGPPLTLAAAGFSSNDTETSSDEATDVGPPTPIYIWVNFGDTSPTSFDAAAISNTLQKIFDDAGLNVKIRVQVTTLTDTDTGLEYDRGYYDEHMDWIGNRLNPTGWIAGIFHWPYIALTEDVLSWNGRINMDNNIGVLGSTPWQDRPTTLKPAKIDELVNRARDRDPGSSIDYTNVWANIILHEQIWLSMLNGVDHNGAGDLTDGGGHFGPLHSISVDIADMIRRRLELD
ncbi:MAG: hypothetical protein KDB01_14245 [Planctomycetaceae bacterium]|nr:hypothetical protein [Planctomycetaceae bacterium]